MRKEAESQMLVLQQRPIPEETLGSPCFESPCVGGPVVYSVHKLSTPKSGKNRSGLLYTEKSNDRALPVTRVAGAWSPFSSHPPATDYEVPWQYGQSRRTRRPDPKQRQACITLQTKCHHLSNENSTPALCWESGCASTLRLRLVAKTSQTFPLILGSRPTPREVNIVWS